MSETVGAAFVLGPGEGRLIDPGGFQMSVKAARMASRWKCRGRRRRTTSSRAVAVRHLPERAEGLLASALAISPCLVGGHVPPCVAAGGLGW